MPKARLEVKTMLKWSHEAIFLNPGEEVEVIDFILPDKIVIGKGLFRTVIGQDDATVMEDD